MPAPAGQERGDIQRVQAVMQMHDLRPRDVAAKADRSRRRGEWIWKTEPLDAVPDADRYVIPVTRVRTRTDVARDPADIVPSPAIAKRQGGSHGLDAADVLGVVVADEEDSHACQRAETRTRSITSCCSRTTSRPSMAEMSFGGTRVRHASTKRAITTSFPYASLPMTLSAPERATPPR